MEERRRVVFVFRFHREHKELAGESGYEALLADTFLSVEGEVVKAMALRTDQRRTYPQAQGLSLVAGQLLPAESTAIPRLRSRKAARKIHEMRD